MTFFDLSFHSSLFGLLLFCPISKLIPNKSTPKNSISDFREQYIASFYSDQK